ncbi:hypothetical protein Hanom_Chr09g00868091 [Helianthus anomalus]
MVSKVTTIGWIISFENGGKVVVVTDIDGRVTESNDSRNHRGGVLSFTCSDDKSHRYNNQPPRQLSGSGTHEHNKSSFGNV